MSEPAPDPSDLRHILEAVNRARSAVAQMRAEVVSMGAELEDISEELQFSRAMLHVDINDDGG